MSSPHCFRNWMFAVFALIGYCSDLRAQTLPGGIDPSWLVWSDEFNGTAIDDSLWRVGSGVSGDVTYIRGGGDAVTMAGGALTIKTYTEGGVNYSGYIDTSSFEETQWTYGYFESRIQFNSSSGMNSAFWLNSHGMADPIVGDPGATGMEIDIVEHRRTNASGTNYAARVHSAVHWDGYEEHHDSDSSTSGNLPGMGNGSWHTYGLLWEPDQYTFYFDGQVRWTVNNPISHSPQFLLLTSHVENGGWAGSIPAGGYGSAATSTTNMMVDYVRVYSLTEPPPPPPPVPALLAHWTFDGHANDSGAAGQHGTLVGSATYLTSGQAAGSGALHLPDAHGAVAVNQTNELLQGHAKATLMAWVRVDGGPVGNDARVPNIFARDLGIGDPWEANRLEIAIELRTDPTTWRAWGINNDPMSGIGETGATTGINDGQWHHLAVVFDSSQNDQFTLYHNGQLDDTWAGGDLSFANFDHAAIGAFLDGANGVVPDNALIGAIDDVQLYSVALSAEQIAFLYSNPGQTVDFESPGDFNSDGFVDGTDFLIWQRNLSIGSLDDWKDNFGNGSAVSATAVVPEPATAMLLLVGAIIGRFAGQIAARRNEVSVEE